MHQNAPFQRRKYKNFSGQGAQPPPQTPTPSAPQFSNPLQTTFLATGLCGGIYTHIPPVATPHEPSSSKLFRSTVHDPIAPVRLCDRVGSRWMSATGRWPYLSQLAAVAGEKCCRVLGLLVGLSAELHRDRLTKTGPTLNVKRFTTTFNMRITHMWGGAYILRKNKTLNIKVM